MVPKLANYYVELLDNLTQLEEWAKGMEPELPIEPTKMNKKFASVLIDVFQDASNLGFNRTRSRINRLYRYLDASRLQNTFGQEEVVYHVKVIREALHDDLKERTVFLPTREQAKYFNNEKQFGDQVYEAFPSARSDIAEAGSCYATDNFTACLFHSMRVAERGMRVLAKDLKVKKVGRYPIEYSEWGPFAKRSRPRSASSNSLRAVPRKRGS